MYGAFASAIGYILHCGNLKNTDLKKTFEVYRGLTVSSKELEERFVVGSLTNLKGFASTTLLRPRALGFAMNGQTLEESAERCATLLEIEFTGGK